MRLLEPLPPIAVSDIECEKLLLLSAQMRGSSPGISAAIDAELSRATVVEADALPADVAAIGKEVAFTLGGSASLRRVVLSWPGEADFQAGRLSIATPVGVALIGLRQGQSIAWTVDSGGLRSLALHEVGTSPLREPLSVD